MSNPTVSVIIVTYNSSRHIEQCLDALFVSLKGIKSEVIVVDNLSSDDTLKMLEKYKKKITLITSKKNGGFARGVNLGYTKARGEYIWLLNPDAYVTQECIGQLLDTMKQNPKIAIAGGQMRNVDDSLQASFGYRPSPIRELFQLSLLYRILPIGRVVMPGIITTPLFNTPHPVWWVSGGCMMIRRSCLPKGKKILDESYFMYMEDVDLCLNMRKKGHEVWYVPSASVIHIHSASFGNGVGRFTYANILEAQSLLRFWKVWYPHHHVFPRMLRSLLKTKLAMKLAMAAPADGSNAKKALAWNAWKKI